MAGYKEFKPDNDFDSRIIPSFASVDPRYFGFVIILRIALLQLNPPKGQSRFSTRNENQQLGIGVRWNEASWVHFKQEFLRVVLATWDGAFLLSPPDSYNGFVWPERDGPRRDVLCGLYIKLVDSERESPHAVLRVVRLETPETHFGADSTLLASNDAGSFAHGDLEAGYRWRQHPAAHEVGHLLGLHHVAQNTAACRSDFLKCYGRNVVEKVNIMGSGDQLSLENAKPWKERIAWHSGVESDEWKVAWASTAARMRGKESFERIPDSSRKNR